MESELLDTILYDLDDRHRGSEEDLNAIYSSVSILERTVKEHHILISSLSSTLSSSVVKQNTLLSDLRAQKGLGETTVSIDDLIQYLELARDQTENVTVQAKASAAHSVDVIHKVQDTEDKVQEVIISIANVMLPNLHAAMATVGLLIATKQRESDYRIPIQISEKGVTAETFNNAINSELLDRHPPTTRATASNSLSQYQ